MIGNNYNNFQSITIVDHYNPIAARWGDMFSYNPISTLIITHNLIDVLMNLISVICNNLIALMALKPKRALIIS